MHKKKDGSNESSSAGSDPKPGPSANSKAHERLAKTQHLGFSGTPPRPKSFGIGAPETKPSLPAQELGRPTCAAPQPARVSLLSPDESLVAQLPSWLNSTQDLFFASAHSDCRTALRAVPELKPAVILIDTDLPNRCCRDCALALKRLLPDLRILILIRQDDEETLIRFLMAGASGWLPKSSHPSSIVLAIRELAHGIPFLPEAAILIQRVLQHLSVREDPADLLTAREREVLVLHASGTPHKLIADVLSVSVRTVQTHVTNGSRKLGVSNKEELAAVLLHLQETQPRSRNETSHAWKRR